MGQTTQSKTKLGRIEHRVGPWFGCAEGVGSVTLFIHAAKVSSGHIWLVWLPVGARTLRAVGILGLDGGSLKTFSVHSLGYPACEGVYTPVF